MPNLFELHPGTISFAGGLPDLTDLPAYELAEHIARRLRLGASTLLQYSPLTVRGPLTSAITDLTAREHIPASEHLIPTSGSQTALVAVARGLAEPGDAVICESPAYPGASAAFQFAGLTLVDCPIDEHGLNPNALVECVKAARRAGHRVRFVYTVPTFHNPTGITQPPQRRRELMRVCADLDLLVVEDNPYGLLSFTDQTFPALKSIAPERVVYLGTFSKVLAPGLRCGWIDPPTYLHDQLRSATEVLTLSPSALAHDIVGIISREAGWDALINGYRQRYRAKHESLRRALAESALTDAGWRWTEPSGGFYLWLTGPDGIDTFQLAERATQHRVMYVPGCHFAISEHHPYRTCLRLSFSHCRPDLLADGARRLACALTGDLNHTHDSHDIQGSHDTQGSHDIHDGPRPLPTDEMTAP